MWIDSNFMNKVGDALDALAIGTEVSIDKVFEDYSKNDKYKSIIMKLHATNHSITAKRKSLDELIYQSELMAQAAISGELDTQIDLSDIDDSVKPIANNINSFAFQVRDTILDINENLDKLSAGDFKAEVTEDYQGAFGVAKEATNNLGKYLNFLIEDSNTMNEAAKIGELDVRIDSSKYQGDFQLIAGSVNEFATQVGDAFTDTIYGLTALQRGEFSTQITTEYQGDFDIVKQSVNSLGKYLNFLIEDSNTMNEATKIGELDVRIDTNKYQGDFQTITESINDTMDTNEKETWIKDGSTDLNKEILSKDTLQEQTDVAISNISRYIEAGVGALYLFEDKEKVLHLRSTYAYVDRSDLSSHYELGKGVVGQVGLERKPILLRNIKRDSLVIDTATTQEVPKNSYTYPVVYKDELLGVIEVASYEEFDAVKQAYFNTVVENLGATLYASIQADKTQKLLEQTQLQAEELEESSQQLVAQNEELEEQRQAMEEQTQELESQKNELEAQKDELELSQEEVKKRAQDLEDSNKYKSEFLANMSHELRTPLNSINMLSKILQDNKGGNLTGKDVDRAHTINQAGKDLLQLITDILDLSKIEAKMMSLSLKDVHLGAVVNELKNMFEPVVDEQNKTIIIDIDENMDKMIYTDKEKLRQILKNFISNAIKFTDPEGTITFKVSQNMDSATSKKLPIKIGIIDTGIGIPADKIDSVFEAFKQADGSTSRKYGGTGLGLSISKELSQLLGGEIVVTSKVDEGSNFSILLPSKVDTSKIDKELVDIIEPEKAPSNQFENKMIIKKEVYVADDRHDMKKGDKSILIIEDDDKFANIVKEEAQSMGLKAIVALNGEDGISLAKKYNPSGIILDMNLPIMDGWDVLKLLKENVNTRHIPVKIMSGDEPNIAIKRMGAVEYIQKPVEPEQLDDALKLLIAKSDKKTKDLLIVEDNETIRENLAELLGINDKDVNVVAVATAKEAIEAVKQTEFDCAIVDMGLPDMDGFELLEIVKRHDCNLPVIVYTGREFTASELTKLREYSESIVLKTADGMARLLDESTLFLHRIHNNLNAEQKGLLHESLQTDTEFLNKKILIVDDDIRNIFALSAVLEDRDMDVIIASDGQEALDQVANNDDIDIVLMDIMMPVMNGYEAIAKIRETYSKSQLPIIALTAKAQPDDRKKCIDVGANDYMSKPIDTDQLLQLMKLWMKNKA